MENMKTLHVIGFKNSGKTTLIIRWVRLLKEAGLSVAVLKHHGHHTPLDMPNSKTDTMQFFESGADVSVVAGAGAVQLHMNKEPDFARMKEIATIENPDVLLIEGYKEERGEKVVLLSSPEDWEALQSIEDIQLVVGNIKVDVTYTKVNSRSAKELDDWLLNWVKELTTVIENSENHRKI